jgi:hypothetical protein
MKNHAKLGELFKPNVWQLAPMIQMTGTAINP